MPETERPEDRRPEAAPVPTRRPARPFVPNTLAPKPAKRFRSRLRWLALGLLALCALGAGLGFWFWKFTTHTSQNTVTVQIPKGANLRQVSALLAEKGLAPKDFRCLLWLRFSGLAGQLKAGEYRFAPGMTPPEVLRKIARGEVDRHPVTVVEGWRLEQIATVFAAGGYADAAEFLRLCRDPAFVRELGLKVDNLEGYLFPETYFMDKGQKEKALIRRMVRQFQQVWKGLSGVEQSGLTQHEIVTLASVVEKETGKASERPLVARVFLNRLKLGMPLQSDPTVIYGLGADWRGRLRKADLRQPTPHNTYVIKGLPPGPICSPGKAALEAVLHPADSEALYFVSRNDGSHVFSRTLAEHNRAVNQFQRGKHTPGAAEGTGSASPKTDAKATEKTTVSADNALSKDNAKATESAGNASSKPGAEQAAPTGSSTESGQTPKPQAGQ